jgi:AbrB family looped-hinge helix DNA binding protein
LSVKLLFVSKNKVFHMNTVKVGRRGQITLPRSIRRQVGIDEGDRVVILAEGGQIIIQPLTKTLLDLRGSVPVSGEQDFSAIRKQVISDQVKPVHGDGS